MKIIYFSPHPNLYLHIPSGPGVHMREMIHAMEELDHEVIPLIMGGIEAMPEVRGAASPSGSSNKSTLKSKLKKWIPKRIWQTVKDLQLMRFDRYAQRELERVIRSEKPDLIYERAFYLSTSGVRAAKKHGVKHILEMNAPYPEERRSMEGPGFLDGLGVARERTQLRLTDRIVVVSSALRDYVIQRESESANKTVITPNAIRSDFRPPDPERIALLRGKLELEGKRVVGFIGSIFPYHGVDRLITAFNTLCQTHSDLALLIVGDGEVLPELRALAASLGTSGAIVFTGQVPHEEAPVYVALMDIAVMPHSNWYGSPVKVFEYGALGKTIVAPDLAPLRDVIVSGEHGLLMEDGKLYESIQELLIDPERAQSMGRSFQAKVQEEHTWKRMAQRVLG